MKHAAIGTAIAIGFALLAGCAQKTVLISESDVKVTWAQPPAKCQEVGVFTGRAAFVHGTQNDAIKDLRQEATRRGANYVKLAQFSGTGQVVTGTGYNCP